MTVIDELVTAHLQLRQTMGLPTDEPTTEPTKAQIERGWVPFPLADEHVRELETLAGFTFSPLLRALFKTRHAMESSTPTLHGVSDWVNGYALEKNRDIAQAREQYDWELPRLVAITWDEDFLAVTEDNQVVRICSNEGNIDARKGTLENWLTGYIEQVQRYVADPDGYDPDDDDEDSDEESDEDSDE